MARRRYYRRAIRVYPKKKWASNFMRFELPSSGDTRYTTLVENKSQSTAPTPVIIKTGNFKVQGDVTVTTTSSIISRAYMEVYIIFIPEGWNMANINTAVIDHPEWILGWTMVDMNVARANTTTEGSKFSITSRLKRNLNSGDKIVFWYNSGVPDVSSGSFNLSCCVQYFTCAN